MKISLFGRKVDFKAKKEKELKPIQSPATQKMVLDVEFIKKLKPEGVSNRKIAEKLKVSEGTIRNRLKNN